MSVEGKKSLLPTIQAKRLYMSCLHLSNYGILSCQVLSLNSLASDIYCCWKHVWYHLIAISLPLLFIFWHIFRIFSLFLRSCGSIIMCLGMKLFLFICLVPGAYFQCKNSCLTSLLENSQPLPLRILLSNSINSLLLECLLNAHWSLFICIYISVFFIFIFLSLCIGFWVNFLLLSSVYCVHLEFTSSTEFYKFWWIHCSVSRFLIFFFIFTYFYFISLCVYYNISFYYYDCDSYTYIFKHSKLLRDFLKIIPFIKFHLEWILVLKVISLAVCLDSSLPWNRIVYSHLYSCLTVGRVYFLTSWLWASPYDLLWTYLKWLGIYIPVPLDLTSSSLMVCHEKNMNK